MTFDEFRRETSNLEAFYEKTLNPTQMQIWFDELKNYTGTKYKRAIQKVCKTSQYKPTLSVILEAIRTIRDEESDQTKPVECKACKGTGYILYKKVIGGIPYEYASQCNCANGDRVAYDGQKCVDKSDYYLAKAVDVFGANVKED